MKFDRSRPRAAAPFAEPLEPRRLLAAAVPPADAVAIADAPGTLAGIVADPNRNRAYVADAGNRTLIVIDTQSAAQVATIALAGEPSSLAVSADGASVIVALPYAHQVQLVSTATLAVQRTLDVGAPLVRVTGGVGGKFYAVASTDAALDAFLTPQTLHGSQSVAQYDLATGARGPSLDAPGDSNLFVRADAGGGRLYVGSDGYFASGDGSVLAYDVSRPSAPRALDPIAPEYGRFVDVFDDRAAGRRYLADNYTGRVEVRRDDGTTAASWLPYAADGDAPPGWAAGTLAGVEGRPGGGLVFATYAGTGGTNGTSSMSTVVAFDAATGAVRQTYELSGTSATYDVVVAPDGRLAFVGGNEAAYDEDEVFRVGLVGASTTIRLAGAPNVIVGNVFFDANGDGVARASEGDWAGEDDYGGRSAVTVYADLDGDGELDAREPQSTRYGAGAFRLELPAASGTYAIRLMPNAGDVLGHLPLYAAGAAVRTVTLGDGEQRAGVDFGVAKGVTIGGVVFADLDGDGRRGDREPAVAGAQVFLDANDDGVRQPAEPIGTMPSDDGGYEFDYAYEFDARGSVGTVRLLNPKGYALTTPAAATIAGTPADDLTIVDFGVRPQLTVGGALYGDANGNGRRDAGERALAGARVWIDLDGNGKYKRGEPTALSSADGAYLITARERGTAAANLCVRDAAARPMRVAQTDRAVRFADWRQAIVGDLGAYVPAMLSITAYLDLDRNRKHSRGDRWLAYTIAYVDLDDDGRQDKNEPSAVTDALGHATFADLPPGTYAVRLRVSSKLKATGGTTLTTTLGAGESRQWSAAVRTA